MLGSPSGVEGGQANSCAPEIAAPKQTTAARRTMTDNTDTTDRDEPSLTTFILPLPNLAGWTIGAIDCHIRNLSSLDQNHFGMKQAAGHTGGQANQLRLPRKHLDPL